ncbi:hypothetical protein MMC11_006956 [Xylographa trunciseda]|nr:hypothetical protein [Xylographa trunciseda]
MASNTNTNAVNAMNQAPAPTTVQHRHNHHQNHHIPLRQPTAPYVAPEDRPDLPNVLLQDAFLFPLPGERQQAARAATAAPELPDLLLLDAWLFPSLEEQQAPAPGRIVYTYPRYTGSDPLPAYEPLALQPRAPTAVAPPQPLRPQRRRPARAHHVAPYPARNATSTAPPAPARRRSQPVTTNARRGAGVRGPRRGLVLEVLPEDEEDDDEEMVIMGEWAVRVWTWGVDLYTIVLEQWECGGGGRLRCEAVDRPG